MRIVNKWLLHKLNHSSLIGLGLISPIELKCLLLVRESLLRLPDESLRLDVGVHLQLVLVVRFSPFHVHVELDADEGTAVEQDLVRADQPSKVRS